MNPAARESSLDFCGTGSGVLKRSLGAEWFKFEPSYPEEFEGE
jgi:hypothetical protein